MKYITAVLCALLILCGTTVSQAATGIIRDARIGGGFLWNNDVQSPLNATGGMFHIATSLNLAPSFSLTPFYELSRRNKTNTTLAGGEVHFNLPIARDSGSLYLGPGLGIANAGGQTKVQLSGTAGAELALNRQFGVFLEGKYVWAPDNLLNGVSAYSGLTFYLHRE